MPNVTASYSIAVFEYFHTLLYLHQSFTNCMCNQYTHTDTLICQMLLQVMECLLTLLRFFANFAQDCTKTFINYVFDVNINISLLQNARCDRKLWNAP